MTAPRKCTLTDKRFKEFSFSDLELSGPDPIYRPGVTFLTEVNIWYTISIQPHTDNVLPNTGEQNKQNFQIYFITTLILFSKENLIS